MRTLDYKTDEVKQYLNEKHEVISVSQMNNIVKETVKVHTGEIIIISHQPMARNIFTDYFYA